MPERDTHTVTGAYGFSGKYLARRLLERGHRVNTLTDSLGRENPFGAEVKAHPFDFDEPKKLARTLEGTRVLYNTYWVRFDHRDFNHDLAVRNTQTLFECARRAGVERVVHVSITNPRLDSPLPYFRGKARLERDIEESGLSYAILRPAVLFGPEDILINNIAWMLRRFPVFGVFGDGGYGIQPIHVDDLAALAVEHGQGTEPVIVDAIGPDKFTYRGLVEQLGEIIGSKRPIVSLSPGTGYLFARCLGLCLRDVIITREEIAGLMAGLLAVDAPATGTTSLIEWARQNRDALGRAYANELGRRRDRTQAYQ
jgi:NADH dehydrogenase